VFEDDINEELNLLSAAVRSLGVESAKDSPKSMDIDSGASQEQQKIEAITPKQLGFFSFFLGAKQTFKTKKFNRTNSRNSPFRKACFIEKSKCIAGKTTTTKNH
jgi:hypothetical protein